MTKKFTLSASGKIAAALALAYSFTTPSAFAEIQSANGNTNIQRIAGVEVINIAKPSDSGLSHNQYNKYNVEKKGAVLNNAVADGTSVLAGKLKKNNQLQNKAASVILNEVVSRNPSTLAGKQEIFGQKADYVLANPNGIHCDGCGFINTPRASLVVGTPTVDQGKLTGYQVSGNNGLSTSGKITQSSTEQLDLIAPVVNISGDISGGKVNVVLGRNTIHRDQQGALSIEVNEPQGQVLDGKIAGSIQAGRIRIHSTDERATLNMPAAHLVSKDIVISSANANVEGVVTQQQNRTDDLSYDKKTRAKIVTSRTTNQGSYQKAKIQADKLTLNIKNQLTLTGAEIAAKEGDFMAGNIQFGTQKTENYLRTGKDQSKGKWSRHEVDETNQQTVHRTELKVDKLNLIATKGKVEGNAVKLSTQDGLIYGNKGIALQGVAETKTENAISDFQRETAKLKTGHSYQKAKTDKLIQSELNVKGKLILAGQGDVNLSAVKGNVDGKLLLNNKGKTTFTTQAVQNTYSLDDKQKFWGGIAGSKTLGKGRAENVQYGSDFTINGLAYIDSQGVNIKGSRLLANEGYINANKQNIHIDNAMNQLTEHSTQRTGTIFDITKERKNSYTQTSTAKGSEIKSKTNLALVSEKDLNVLGSQISALGTLTLAIKENINLIASENYAHHQEHQSGFNLSAKAAKPMIKLDQNAVVNGLLDNAKNKKLTVESTVDLLKNNVKLNAEASATLGIYNKNQDSHATTHTATTVTGNQVDVTTNHLNVTGSQLNATEGDLTLKAEKVNTQAAIDRLVENSRETTAGITTKVKLTESSITGTVDVGVQHKQQHTDTHSAQSSALTAKRNLNIDAETITHQGTKLTAGNDVTETANQIHHTTAQSSSNQQTNTANVGATLTTSINKQKAINGSLNISAEGGKQSSQSVTHQATQIQSGNNIAVNSQQLNDGATQYQAGNDIQLNSKQHNAIAVHNQQHNQSFSAGVNVGIEASTADMQTVNVGVNVGGKYQQDQSASATAQKANLVAGNDITVNTQKLHSQADMQAGNNVNINAKQGATFSQATNSETHSGGGFEANVGVGALVIPAASATIPSIDIDVAANGNNGQKNEAVMATIQGQNVAINSNGATQLQGTHINAKDNATISGNTVNIESGHSNIKDVNGKVGVGIGLGEAVSSAKLKLNAQVNHENSDSHTAANVNAQNLAINSAQGTTLTGTNVESKQLNLQTGSGNLNLTAVPDHTNKTNVGVDFSLGGGVANNQWKPTAGSGSVDVNVVRNEIHTGTSVKSENTALNVGKNVNVTGSTLTSNAVSGTVAGDVNLQTLSNKTNETHVSLSANGSGKLTPYPQDKWQESAKKDWNNGTIAGVKADIKAKVNVKRQRTHSQAKFVAKTRQPTVKGKVNVRRAPLATSRQVNVAFQANTRVKEMMEKAQALFNKK